MSRVDITAGGRSITIQHDGDLDAIAAQAEHLWKVIADAAPAEPSPAESGSVLGFHTERAPGAEYVSAHPVDLGAQS